MTAVAELVAFAREKSIDLTVVGPEAPLAAGVVDAFRASGLRIFGPTRAAAQLESSKDFAKAFMVRHGIPTARYAHVLRRRAKRTPTSMRKVRRSSSRPMASPPARASSSPSSATDAHAAIDAMLVDNAMGDAGARVVIEECLTGEEASFIVMVDGRHVLPLASSQDHKRLRDGDSGPNTGGMGAYSPAPVVTPALHARLMREVILPTVQGMAADGIRYSGFLYAGVMIDALGQPKVLEFNCRMGDPETQPIIVRLKSDLVDLLEHAVAGTLDRVDAEWDRRTALGVVLAAHGYPDSPRKGDAIRGLDELNAASHPDVHVFHAGTVGDGDAVVTAGGRVLCVTALGDSVKQAQRAAYAAVGGIEFDGMQYRKDIGHRALARK